MMSRMRAVFVLSVVTVALGCAAPAWALAAWTGVVANNFEPTDAISTFDASTATFGQNIDDGADNTWVGVSPDGTKAYASLVHLFNGMKVIDLNAKAVTDSVSYSSGTFWGAIAPDGRTAYLSGSNVIVPVDLSASPPVAKPSITASGISQVAVSPDGTTLYGAGNGGVTPFNLATGGSGTRIPTGAGAEGIAISPDGSTLWIANHDAKTVSRVRVADSSVMSIPISAGHPGNLAISADGDRVWVTLRDEHKLTSISTATNSVAAAVDTGGVEARGVQVTPDGKTVYVSDGTFNGSGTGSQVTPVDATTSPPTVKPTITGFRDPVWVSITPDQPPIATFTVASSAGGQPTTFDASGSAPGSTPVASYAWDFGDGATATTTGPKTTHVYKQSGTFQATVTETDTVGTSTTPVYTGQQVLRNGGPRARATRSVFITAGPAPAVSLSSDRLDFGTVAVGTPAAPQIVTVTNTGHAPLDVASAALSGGGASDYTVTRDGCTHQPVAPGSGCEIEIGFTPTASGDRGASLALTDNASGSPHTIVLSGLGTTIGGIAGTVRDAGSGGRPVAGASVSVCTYSTRAICKSDVTDGSGRYSVGGLPQARYQVEVLPAGGSLFPGSAAVDVVPGPEVTQDFDLSAPRPLPAGVSFNGQQGGTPRSFWTAPTDVQETLQVPTGLPAGTLGVTVVYMTAGPQTDDSGTASAVGPLTVIYRYDSHGVPRFLELDQRDPFAAGSDDSGLTGLLGRWNVGLVSPPAVGQPVTGLKADGVLVPPAHGPFFHGAARYSLEQLTFHIDAAAGTSPDLATIAQNHSHYDDIMGRKSQIGDIMGGNGGGQGVCGHTYPNGRFYNPHASPPTLTDPAGTKPRHVYKQQKDKNGNPLHPLVNGVPVTVNGHVLDSYTDERGNQRYVDPQTGTVYDSKGNVVPVGPVAAASAVVLSHASRGSADDAPADNSCMKPDSDIDGYVDPSGLVVTKTGAPVALARVTLSRAGARAGRQHVVPNGSSIMSPANRRNPDRSDALGHFGWDVIPGFYTVTAQHAGCRPSSGHGHRAHTEVLQIPPPVTNLTIRLSCPGLRRGTTAVATRARPVPYRRLLLSIRIRQPGRGKHRQPLGTVIVTIGGRRLAMVPLTSRGGVVTTTVPRPASGKRITVRYAGDGFHAPSVTRLAAP